MKTNILRNIEKTFILGLLLILCSCKGINDISDSVEKAKVSEAKLIYTNESRMYGMIKITEIKIDGNSLSNGRTAFPSFEKFLNSYSPNLFLYEVIGDEDILITDSYSYDELLKKGFGASYGNHIFKMTLDVDYIHLSDTVEVNIRENDNYIVFNLKPEKLYKCQSTWNERIDCSFIIPSDISVSKIYYKILKVSNESNFECIIEKSKEIDVDNKNIVFYERVKPGEYYLEIYFINTDNKAAYWTEKYYVVDSIDTESSYTIPSNAFEPYYTITYHYRNRLEDENNLTKTSVYTPHTGYSLTDIFDFDDCNYTWCEDETLLIDAEENVDPCSADATGNKDYYMKLFKNDLFTVTFHNKINGENEVKEIYGGNWLEKSNNGFYIYDKKKEHREECILPDISGYKLGEFYLDENLTQKFPSNEYYLIDRNIDIWDEYIPYVTLAIVDNNNNEIQTYKVLKNSTVYLDNYNYSYIPDIRIERKETDATTFSMVSPSNSAEEYSYKCFKQLYFDASHKDKILSGEDNAFVVPDNMTIYAEICSYVPSFEVNTENIEAQLHQQNYNSVNGPAYYTFDVEENHIYLFKICYEDTGINLKEADDYRGSLLTVDFDDMLRVEKNSKAVYYLRANQTGESKILLQPKYYYSFDCYIQLIELFEQ